MVTHHLSITVWSPFAFPPAEEEHWRQECLLYYLGRVVNVRACMPGIKLGMRKKEGQFGNCACALKFEGHMPIYDPHEDILEWIPM